MDGRRSREPRRLLAEATRNAERRDNGQLAVGQPELQGDRRPRARSADHRVTKRSHRATGSARNGASSRPDAITYSCAGPTFYATKKPRAIVSVRMNNK